MNSKPRKHRWITEAIKEGKYQLSVWPTPDEISTDKKRKAFMEVIEKIGNDPRVNNVNKYTHHEYSMVFVFDIQEEK